MTPQTDTRDDSPTPDDQLRIGRRIDHFFLGAIGVLSLLAAVALVSYYAGNQSTNYRPMPMMSGAAAAPPQTVTVAMHDPGCHWFQVGTTFQKRLAVTGPVRLVNSDEAALKIAGSTRTVRDVVGQAVALAPGSYTITMVGQAPDDNTLRLAVS
jgi:hypothetical protein